MSSAAPSNTKHQDSKMVLSQREAIIVDLSRRGPGEERVHLDAFDVHAPEGMTVADVSPTIIDVALDRRIEKMVLVEPDLTGRPPFGYELGEVLAAITDGTTIRQLLAHLGLPTEPLPVAPACEPPQLDFAW